MTNELEEFQSAMTFKDIITTDSSSVEGAVFQKIQPLTSVVLSHDRLELIDGAY